MPGRCSRCIQVAFQKNSHRHLDDSVSTGFFIADYFADPDVILPILSISKAWHDVRKLSKKTRLM